MEPTQPITFSIARRAARLPRARIHLVRQRLSVLLVVSAIAACAPPIRSTIGRPPTLTELAPFWVDPPAGRNLFYGSGGERFAPRPDVVYKLDKRESGGFSPKLQVFDPNGVKWSVKLGDEAQSEVTSSRIVWAVGYRQAPGYYLEHWRIQDETGVHHMGPGRFRPHLEEFKSRGSWSWHSNPFVDAVQFRGLIVLMMILNSTDLKDVNNEIYRVRSPGEKAEDWYTVKDLGASLGQTGRVAPKRNNIDFFEKQAFVTGQENGFVRFEFHGRHQELLHHIRPADVRWMCERLRALSPEQWRQAFRAGGYDDATTARYLRKIDEKIAQGLTMERGAPR